MGSRSGCPPRSAGPSPGIERVSREKILFRDRLTRCLGSVYVLHMNQTSTKSARQFLVRKGATDSQLGTFDRGEELHFLGNVYVKGSGDAYEQSTTYIRKVGE